MPDALPPQVYAAPAFSEFHRAQLRMVANGATGEILPRAAVLAALRHAEARAGGMTPEGCARLRIACQEGRPSIFVWADEARKLLAALPDPAREQHRADAAMAAGDPRPAIIALAEAAFDDARQVAGHDDRARDAFNRLGERALAIAALLPRQPAQACPVVQRAQRLFGALA